MNWGGLSTLRLSRRLRATQPEFRRVLSLGDRSHHMCWSLVRGTRAASLLAVAVSLAAGVTAGCGGEEGRGVDVRQSAATTTPAFVQVAAATPQSATATVTVT